MKDQQEQFAYLGTYGTKDNAGIYLYTYNIHSGQLTPAGSVSGIENTSFLAVNRQKYRLYAVSETETFDGQKGGSVTAFAIQPTSGTLSWLNQQPTLGGAPCHLSVDEIANTLLVVNYNGGNISTFPLEENGEIGPMAQNIQHTGKGVRADRQEAPHPHSVVLTSDNHYALVPDLGLDKIFIYQLEHKTHTLIKHGETDEAPGSGPRCLVFHPSGKFVYSINELNSTISAFAFDAQQVSLKHLQTVSALPADFVGKNTSADIHISPSGAFLYGSNRGHDSLVVFAIQQDTGMLSYVQHVSTDGKTPRNFALAPDGRFLFAANQNSDSIVTYQIDQATGQLTQQGTPLNIPRPVCIKIFSKE